MLDFFKYGKFPKKKLDITTSETSCNELYESYYSLPIHYQYVNKLDIEININITLDDLINNNQKKIKIKREINNKQEVSTFVFNLENQYIVFPIGGDIKGDNKGALKIKLVLPNNYIWDTELIIIEQSMTIYEMIYGLDIELSTNTTSIKIPKWVPSRDGFLIDIKQIKIKDYSLGIKLVLKYDHTDEHEELLKRYFN
jgi:hypothetical protein